jgi:hypothetical protein
LRDLEHIGRSVVVKFHGQRIRREDVVGDPPPPRRRRAADERDELISVSRAFCLAPRMSTQLVETTVTEAAEASCWPLWSRITKHAGEMELSHPGKHRPGIVRTAIRSSRCCSRMCGAI